MWCDLNVLVVCGLFVMMYGGVLVVDCCELSLFECEVVNVDVKCMIGWCVVEFVFDDVLVLIDLGSMLYVVVLVLVDWYWLLIYMNDWCIVFVFVWCNGNCVMLFGGELFDDEDVIFGFDMIY